MAKRPNPAGRLIKIVQALLNVPQQLSVRQAWASAFGLKSDNLPGILNAVSGFFALIEKTKADISKVKGIDHQTYLDSFHEIQRILDPANLQNAWDSIRPEVLRPHVMLGLRFCDDLLSREVGEDEIEPKQLVELSKTISDAIRAISDDTDLPPMLRSLLCAQLNCVLESIAGYKIWGVESLKSSIQHAVGAILAQQNVLEGQEDSRGFAKFKEVLQSVADVVANVTTVSQPAWQLAINSVKLLG